MPRTNKLSRPARLAVLALLAVAALFPVQTVTSPQRTIVFVDKKARPLANLPVRQVWKNYSAESSSNEETRSTDSNGSVTFPERYAHSPLLVRLLKPAGNVLATGVHASFGASSYLVQLCDLLEAEESTVALSEGKLPTRAVLTYFDRSPIRAATGGVAQQGCQVIEAQVREAGA